MARAWRIEYEGALYHVLSRGNEKQNIVTNDDDRKLFLATVGEMVERFEIDLYVLMDNTITFYFEPIAQTYAEACSGLGLPTPKDLTCIKVEAAIYFKVVIKICWYKTTPTCCSFPIISTAIH